MKSTLRVLNIEDSERDVELLRRHLARAGYALIFERVETPATMKAALEAQPWDIILSDYSMPHFNALQALALLKETGLDIPFIIISGTVGEETAVEAMRAGAHDYLMKDNLMRLAPTIERELHEAENRRARRQAEESLKASEAELRALFAAMNDVILVLDTKGRYLKIAPTDPTYLYKPPDDLIGKTLHEVFPKEQADFFLDHIRRALKEGQAHRVEYSLQLGGGAAWFEGSVSPMSKDSVVWIARDITERKRAEEEKARLITQLESQRQRLNNIVASVPGCVFEAWGKPDTATQSIDFISDYVETMLGYSVAEWLSTPNFWLTIVHPDDQEWVARESAASFVSGQPGRFEFRWIAKDGHIVWVESRTVTVTNDGGQPLGMRGVNIDISERKRAEADFRKQQEMLQSIFDHIPVMISFYDRQGHLKLVNREWEKKRGWTLAEIQEHDVDILAESYPDPQERQRVRDIIAAANGEWADFKTRGKDGRVDDMAWAAVRLSDGTSVTIGQDIAERKRVEELQRRRVAQAALRADVSTALTSSDGSLRSILEHCTEALVHHLGAAFARIWTLNRDENMLELQASAGLYTHIDGPHARVPVGKFKIGLIAEERAPHITNDVQSDPRVGDKEWARQEGMIAFAGYPLIVEDRLVGVIAMFARQALAEDTLEALGSVADIISQGIARKRVEDTLRRRDEQLRHSQKMEAIGTLAGGIAHDFNNALGIIMGCCELAQWSLPTDHVAQARLDRVLEASNRAKELIQQILTFSRQKEHERKPILLQPVLQETLKLLRATLPSTIELRQHIDQQALAVLGDPTQIHQVMMNLGTNALHAMQERGGILEVKLTSIYFEADIAKTHPDLHEGRYLQLVITDTGHGMDRATIERIYEPFFTTKAPGEGTGLGLAVVHGIVKKHEGAVSVYSEPGRGTTFKLYFPVYKSDTIPAELKSARIANGAGARILFVDDEESLAVLGKEVLEQMGYQVTAQTSSVEALEVFRAHPNDFDLVITDQTMPMMSGVELARALLEIRPELPILLTTGYSATISPEQVQALGIRELLMKPNTARSLGEAIQHALADQRKE